MSKDSSRFYTNQNILGHADDKNDERTKLSSQPWDYVPPEKPVDREPWSKDAVQSGVNEDVPEKILELVKMSRQEPWQMTMTRNKSFFEQAMFMSDYNDSAPVTPFFEYFPVYRSMDIAQLRSYFTFRTLIRENQYPEISLSYIFLYIYEVLMQVGTSSPNQGLDILEKLKNAYAASHPKLIRYLKLWMQDYIAYYNLTDRVDEYFSEQIAEDALAENLADYQNLGDELLFETAASLSSYKIKTALVFKKHTQTVIAVSSNVIRAIAPIYELRHRHRFDEICLGLRKQTSHHMFNSAIFYSSKPVREKIFEISSRRRYLCNGGLWSIDTFNEKILSGKGKLLGEILHETDRRLRTSLQMKPLIIKKMADKEIEDAIQLTINIYLQEREQASRPKVVVDFSKLNQIRSDADVIKNALLSEEEKSSEQPVQLKTVQSQSETLEPDSLQADNNLLTKQERAFLALLIHNENWQDYLREIHMPVGVMSDNINEKLFEDLNDILIDDQGKGPIILEEYIDYISNKI